MGESACFLRRRHGAGIQRAPSRQRTLDAVFQPATVVRSGEAGRRIRRPAANWLNDGSKVLSARHEVTSGPFASVRAFAFDHAHGGNICWAMKFLASRIGA